jgi:putative colanic acid biosynthesis UDP-glucose lipid carrier transferase
MDTQQPPVFAPHGRDLTLLRKIVDAGLIVSAALLAVYLYPKSQWEMPYTIGVLLTTISYLIIAEASGLFRSWRGVRIRSELTRLSWVWLMTLGVLLTIGYLTKTTAEFSRVATTLWMIITPVMLFASRLVMRMFLDSMRRAGRNLRNVAIVGANDLGIKVAELADDNPELGYRLVGFFEDRQAKSVRISWPGRIQGNFDDLIRLARNNEVDLIYITLPMTAQNRIQELLDALADTTVSVRLVPDFFVFQLFHGKWSDFMGLPTVSVFETPFWGVDGWLKRVQDIILGSIILVMISPLLLFIAMGVKLTSPKGPVIFKQRRYGLDGREIMVWKFRSMTTCDNGNTVQQATKGDARITPFGGFLRKTSLDELPQFFNVLMGEMSIVGPRPHAVAHNEEYRGLIKGYMLRHKVKPGITGWAQINGCRGETDTVDKMQNRVEHDLWYIRNWSFWLDLKIVFQTIFKGFVGKQAY